MKTKKFEIAKDILSVLVALGTLAVALVAPNILLLLRKEYKPTQISRSIGVLKNRKMIKGIGENIHLTAEGKDQYLVNLLEKVQIQKPRKWDHKWRVVIFDIPINKNKVRSNFRKKLIELGFMMVQKSIWLTPYECKKEINLMVSIYKISQHVKILTVEEPEIDKKFKKFYNL